MKSLKCRNATCSIFYLSVFFALNNDRTETKGGTDTESYIVMIVFSSTGLLIATDEGNITVFENIWKSTSNICAVFRLCYVISLINCFENVN